METPQRLNRPAKVGDWVLYETGSVFDSPEDYGRVVDFDSRMDGVVIGYWIRTQRIESAWLKSCRVVEFSEEARLLLELAYPEALGE